jgi:hypothetical protein
MSEKPKTLAQKLRKHRQNLAHRERIKERKKLEKFEKLGKTMQAAPNRYRGNDDKGRIKDWEGKFCIFYKGKDGRYIIEINGKTVSVQNSYANAERMAITISEINKANYDGYLEKQDVGVESTQ